MVATTAPEHELTINADSANEVPSMIKGTRGGGYTGLRQVAKSVWDDMLDEVQCKVLSVIEGEEMDAYLLSESSMFVWPHKLILKTCGTTTLLLGLPTLLRIASEICSFPGVWRCFYSRKTFMFPDRQKGPHKDWSQEVSFLDQLFDNSSAYTVGRMNGDHWLLYLTPPRADVLLPTSLTLASHLPPQNPTVPLSALSASFPPSLPRLPSSTAIPRTTAKSTDQTLEILMTHLHPSVCQSFYHPNPDSQYPVPGEALPASDAHELGTALSETLGITSLFPTGTSLDSFLFSPCGYSANAVREDRYATIHVTPEVEYSYASFETNLSYPPAKGDVHSPQSVQELVQRVLNVFKPAKMSITLFVSTEEDDEGKVVKGVKDLLSPDLLEKYTRVDRIVYEFDGYSLVYGVFESKELEAAAVVEEVLR
ncbi:S-adenosylmethionine decarboxylase [Pseudohyphozyma bogoriensis]|nr:S-adenosylmethionine decarboxylase [Pseudohyphozyma bogoriensis]